MIIEWQGKTQTLSLFRKVKRKALLNKCKEARYMNCTEKKQVVFKEEKNNRDIKNAQCIWAYTLCKTLKSSQYCATDKSHKACFQILVEESIISARWGMFIESIRDFICLRMGATEAGDIIINIYIIIIHSISEVFNNVRCMTWYQVFIL